MPATYNYTRYRLIQAYIDKGVDLLFFFFCARAHDFGDIYENIAITIENTTHTEPFPTQMNSPHTQKYNFLLLTKLRISAVIKRLLFK